MIYDLARLSKLMPRGKAKSYLLAAGYRDERTWLISQEDLLKEYERRKQNYLSRDIQDSPHGKDRGAGDDPRERSAKEALRLGKYAKRSRRRSPKQALRVIEGGAEGVDVQEVHG